jgi:raffinose/stachyose/melibiose transport system permease protein
MTSLTAAVARGRISRLRRLRRRHLVAYAFLAPALFLYGMFVLRPTIEVFGLSLFEWDGISQHRAWVGLGNFARLATDPVFWEALGHTLMWVGILVTFNVSLGLATAAALAAVRRGRLVLQLAVFLPVVQAAIVVALIWRWIYNPNGLLNLGLGAVGLDGLAQPWLGDPNLALPALAIAAGWAGFGLAVVIFLAGLQGVDEALYDAARIDGANARQLFRHITVPALRNAITIVILLEMIGAFQVFDIIWGTTQGGPIRSTEVLATYMFKRGIQEGSYGFGSAIAVVFMLLVLTFAIVSVIIRERRDE